MNVRSPAATKTLGPLALVIVAVLAWMLVLGPARAELGEVRSQTSAAHTQTGVLNQQLTELREQERTLPQIRADSAALTASFPATADQPGLFEAVSQAVADAGIPAENLTALTPTPPVVGMGDEAAGVALPTEDTPGNLATQTVTVSVDSTYEEARQLLANLEAMPRAYLVTSLTVTEGERVGQFSTTVIGNMFVMPLAAVPDVVARAPVADSSD
jgi:hypothetical protein